MTKVWITLEGGNVQDILTDDAELEIMVVDFDDDADAAPSCETYSLWRSPADERFVLRADGRPDSVNPALVESLFAHIRQQQADPNRLAAQEHQNMLENAGDSEF